jgi:hypothetical protein
MGHARRLRQPALAEHLLESVLDHPKLLRAPARFQRGTESGGVAVAGIQLRDSSRVDNGVPGSCAAISGRSAASLARAVVRAFASGVGGSSSGCAALIDSRLHCRVVHLRASTEC